VVIRHTGKCETLLSFSESKVLSVGQISSSGAALKTTRGKLLRVEGAKVISKLLDVFFGCRHSHYSFPVTLRGAARRPQAGALTGTYVACLDCGKEFPYDWQEMKVITSPSERQAYVASLATRHAA
jgi:hypothetical protein